jgi:hypothetical protein
MERPHPLGALIEADSICSKYRSKTTDWKQLSASMRFLTPQNELLVRVNPLVVQSLRQPMWPVKADWTEEPGEVVRGAPRMSTKEQFGK